MLSDGDFIELGLSGYSTARHYGQVSSTMDVARGLIEKGPRLAPAKAFILADRQTHGRGRQGRSWLSGEGAFMATFIFEVLTPRAALSGYSLAIGVGIARGLRDLSLEVALKWPNDLVVRAGDSYKKLGGILVEVQQVESQTFLLIGLGINVNPAPYDLAQIASSLREIGQPELRSCDLVRPLAHRVAEAHQEFVEGSGLDGFMTEWRKLNAFRSGVSRLTVDMGAETVCGEYMDIDSSGALVLSVAGSRRVIHSGHLLEIRY